MALCFQGTSCRGCWELVLKQGLGGAKETKRSSLGFSGKACASLVLLALASSPRVGQWKGGKAKGTKPKGTEPKSTGFMQAGERQCGVTC